MGKLKQKLNTNEHPVLDSKLLENGVKKCCKEYDEQNTKFKPRQEKTNQFTHNALKVCHQNIRGLFGKTEQLLNSLLSDPPHLICLSEHHLKEYEIENILVDNYILGAKYCRSIYKKGGVCILIHSSIKFSTVSVANYCVEKDIEACAIKLILTSITMTILAVYRSPSGNFSNFLQKLDNILNMLHNNKAEFIICSDVNINYLENCDRRKRLDAFLSTYNLISTVNFPTRIVKDSRTAIDNIYIHKTRNYTINPLINGLSDHDAQMIVVDGIMSPGQVCNFQYIRNYSNYNINKFQEMLSYELWDDVFINDNVNIFNSFLNTYLRIFYSCFTRRKITPRLKYNPWITQGIRISCKRKRELYLRYRLDSDPHFNLYYKKYCRVLATVIKEAKKAYYDSIILKSRNKIKATWSVIKRETGH
jgi:hypothetical protein